MAYSIIDYINNKSNSEFGFLKLTEIIYGKTDNKCTVNLIYPEWLPDLTAEQKEKITALTKEFLNISASIEVKIKKSYAEPDIIKKFIVNFFENFHASIAGFINNSTLNITKKDDRIDIKISIDSFIKDYFLRKGIESELTGRLSANFCGRFFIEIAEIPADEHFYNTCISEHRKNLEEISIATSFVENKNKRFKIEVTKKLFGDEIKINPQHITLKPSKNVVVAGVIRNVQLKSFTPKKPKLSKDGKPEQRYYYSFVLQDGDIFISGVHFPTKSTINKMNILIDNPMQAVMMGDIEQFNDRFSLKIKALSLCKIWEGEEGDLTYKTETTNYNFVKPEKYTEINQLNIFTLGQAADAKMQGKTFVVFDLETTGMDSVKDQIIEIGAVKITDGIITETFSCFVKPTKHIPEDATAVNGITDEMVAGAYSINQILPDFYKFTRGAALVAHNAPFDCGFIYNIAKKMGYYFDNPVIDTIALAREKLHGVGNFRLITVCNYLGIKLIGAHRAVNDSLATAKIFLKLY